MARGTTGTAPAWKTPDVAILVLLADGHTVHTVARRVGMSERTVRRRLRLMADDLGVETTIEVVVHAVRTGLI